MMFAAVIALKAYSVLEMSARSAQARCLGVQTMTKQSDRPSYSEVFNLPTWYRRPLSAKMVMCRSYALAKSVASQQAASMMFGGESYHVAELTRHGDGMLALSRAMSRRINSQQ